MPRLFGPLLAACLFAGAAHAQGGLDDPVALGAYLNDAFGPVAPGSITPGTGAWTHRDYFPEVSFVEPLRIVEHPTRNELIIVGKDALAHVITHREGATDKRLFFDLRPIVHGNPAFGEGGISDLVFHPDFGTGDTLAARSVFVSYWWSPDNSGEFSNDAGVDGYNRVSRFEILAERLDLSSEQVLISQYDREYWHIGMDMQFGADGFLYISAGDESPTDCCLRGDSTQRLDGGLWSGVLRIDVDNDASRSHPIRRQPRHPAADPGDNGAHWPLSFTQGYSIPNDNPFLDGAGGVLEEFYSVGLRHPWTMSIDAVTGDVWVGDVGRFSREELNLVRRGDNHQWPFLEGTIAGPDAAPATPIGTSRPPVWEYDHDTGVSVILGGVYRGDRHPALTGKVLFSDFKEGQLWTATAANGGYTIEQIGDIGGGWNSGVSSYLMDSRGDILMARTAGALRDGGRIDVLVRENEGPPTRPAPQRLSQTGAFTDLSSLRAIDGCIGYDQNVPFWSDGALKTRWLCIPNDGRHDSAGERIVYDEQAPWTFPVGSVFIKHFAMQREVGIDTSTFPLETRFFIVGEEGYYGLSYRWNSVGTDAELVDAAGETIRFDQVQDAGQTLSRQWDYPGRAQCLECHTANAGHALGVNTRQLNGSRTYPRTGRAANQILTLAELGLFGPADELLAALPDAITARAADDLAAPLGLRARSYLDANCSSCHRPGGVRALFDARLSTPLAQQRLIDGQLIESVGIDGELVIARGDTDRSVLHYRLARLGQSAMPPLAKHSIDTDGVALISDWIVSLGEPEPDPEPIFTTPQPGATLVDDRATFTWTREASVAEWWLYLGSSPGARDLHNSRSLGGALSTSVAGLATDGRTVHATLWYRIEAGDAWRSVAAKFNAATLDPPAFTRPTSGATLDGSSQEFTWVANDIAVDAWWLYLGTGTSGAAAYDLFNGRAGTSTGIRAASLPRDGRTVHATLWYRVNGIWHQQRDTFIAASGGSGGTPPPAATALSPSGSGSGSTPTYAWSSVASASWYYLWVAGADGAAPFRRWVTSVQAACDESVCRFSPDHRVPGASTWWVRTWNTDGSGPWSGGRTFSP